MITKILCYGDSNTFGFNPHDGLRFNENIRWTSVLQKNLGAEYKVLNEGMCDRTGFVDNDKGFFYSAQLHFPEIIKKMEDIEIIILAIGSNDLQFKYDINFHQIEKGLEKLILTAKRKVEKIILIPPVILNDSILKGFFNFQFDKTSISKSRKVGKIYKKLAQIHNCELFDINEITKPSNIDGLHYDENSHKIIADKLTEFVKLI